MVKMWEKHVAIRRLQSNWNLTGAGWILHNYWNLNRPTHSYFSNTSDLIFNCLLENSKYFATSITSLEEMPITFFVWFFKHESLKSELWYAHKFIKFYLNSQRTYLFFRSRSLGRSLDQCEPTHFLMVYYFTITHTINLK